MADRPILFSAPMVRALLAWTKTQTRRALNPQPTTNSAGLLVWKTPKVTVQTDDPAWIAMSLRIGIGDALWVKETYRISSWSEDGEAWITYTADGARSGTLYPEEEFLERLCARVERAGAKLDEQGMYTGIPAAALARPSIFMPRFASRITLHVTDVRVQRLQDISAADAIAEGIECVHQPGGDFEGGWGMYGDQPEGGGSWSSPVRSYQSLWTQINGFESWLRNPWVAAYTFTVECR